MIINTNSTVAFNPATSLSLPVGDNVDGDLIVIAYAIRNTGATITCTGFTHQSSATTTSWKCGFLTKVNSGSATTGPVTVSSTASSYFGATAYVIRGQHATPVGANNSSTSAGTARLASSGLTTTADNSLVLHSFATDRSLFAFPEISGFSLLSNNFTDSGTIISGAEGAGATGAISTFYWDQSASTQCIDAVLEIKMASGNAAVKVVPGRTAIFYHGGYDPSTPTRSAPNSVSGLTAIKSINLSATEPTYTNTAGTTGWIFQGIGFDTSTATTQWDGAWEAATLNLTGKILSFPWAISRANFTDGRVGSYGMICCLADSANNWVAFTLRDSADGWVANKSYTAFIKYGSTPVLESSQSLGGTEINIADVVKIGFFWHRLSGGGAGSTLLYVGPTWYESAATVITGGGSAYPLNTTLITNALGTNTYWPELFPRQGASQYLNKINLQIGDGTRLTNYKSTGQSFEFPTANGVDWTLAAGDVGLTLKSSASDTFDLSSSIFSGGSMQGFTIDSGGSTSATYTLTGASFIGLNWACEIAKSYSGASFSGCNLVELGGSTISGVTVSTPSGTNAAVVNLNSATIDNSTLSVVRDGTDASYHLELGTSVTAITLTDVTWTGTPVTDKVHVLKTTGTVTINISGTTSLAAGDVTSAGATVDIVAPQPTLDATVLADTRVVLYNNTTAAELDNTAPAGTSWSKTITSGASVNDNLTLFAFKEGYEEFSTSFLYSGDDTTILVTQVVDDVVAAFRTEDSITDYTTLTEYNIYAPTIYIQADDADGVSKISRLATYYNGVLTTEDGARYFRGGMSMISTGAVRINKGTIELLLENVSATKSLRFSDEATRRLYTDDGTSIIAPSSVAGSIEYAYGGVPDTVETGVSGLTGPESSQLMSLANGPSAATISTQILTDAQTTPIHSDVRKVIGITVDGTGTDGDPWGPSP